MVGGKPRLKYHCVEVIAPAGGCEAARSLKNTRLLSAEAPRLPLATCDRAADCKCRYRHFNDRRQGPRRDDEHEKLPAEHKGTDRRTWRGRRDSDYE
jgi:predicted metal-binding protein